MEVYIKCDIDKCIKRDTKGLYKKAINFEINDFTGISSPYEVPISPELTIDADWNSITESVNILIKNLQWTIIQKFRTSYK